LESRNAQAIDFLIGGAYLLHFLDWHYQIETLAIHVGQGCRFFCADGSSDRPRASAGPCPEPRDRDVARFGEILKPNHLCEHGPRHGPLSSKLLE
jgi:hypothetical protein